MYIKEKFCKVSSMHCVFKAYLRDMKQIFVPIHYETHLVYLLTD